MLWFYGCVCFVIGGAVGWAVGQSERRAAPTSAPRSLSVRHLWSPDAIAVVKALLHEAVEQKVAEGHAIEASMRVMADRIEGAAQIMEEIETRLRRKFVMVERVAPGIGVKDAVIRTE